MLSGRLRIRVPAAVFLVVGLALAGVVSLQAPSRAAPCDPPITSPIACENTKAGTPASTWDVSGSGSSTIQGFATDISVNKGETVHFKIKTPATAYRLDIYRMGWYGGNGARKVATVNPSATLPQTQPACLNDNATGLVDCGNWAESASWAVPSDAVSGIYFAKLVRTDATSGSSHVVFVVRDDASHSDLLFQTSDTTWQAYNEYGGNSLYTGSPAGRAYKVSYNRPFTTRDTGEEDWMFNAEYPMVRWLESNGYDVTYFTGLDGDRRGSLIRQHRVFMSVGHDEYWSGGQRANVEAARAAGVNLAFFSGNEIFWKTRWEPSIDASHTAYRTLVTYKETHDDAVTDPADPPTWTGSWRDPRFSPPGDGGRPENGLSGTIFTVNCCTYAIKVPAADGKMRFWRNTNIATQAAGGTVTLPDGTLGYEWDEDLDNGARPAGVVRMSTATATVPEKLQDYGSIYGNGTATHHLTLYRASSGALVFGAGTVQWAWGLDSNHDRGSAAVDTRMQQATVNLLADMSAQPATLRSGLVAAARSTDATAPTSVITSPTAGSNLPAGQPVTITGTATDGGGGVVGGVEVSVDGGTTWHPANGRESWTYTWTPRTTGSMTFKSRAADDSGNLETPGPGVPVTVGNSGPGTCPCTIWPSSVTPGTPADSDGAAIEVGVKFRTDVAGVVKGLRFYKGSGNTGTHVGHLWSSTGTQLASATFTGETASGWQQVNFTTPVAVAANTTYVASYYAPSGHYALDDGFFDGTGVDNPPLHALADGADGPNGVYRYGTSGFPSDTYASANYWVDVVFDTSASDTTPPTVSGRSPASGAVGVAPSSNVSATFSEPVQSGTIGFTLTGPGGASVPAAVTYDGPSQTATLNPNADLATSTSYTASVSGARDTAGNQMTAPVTWSFTTAAAGDTTPPTVTVRSPASGATGVAPSANVTATFSEPVQAATVTFTLTGPGGAGVAAAVSYDGPSQTATLNPNADLANSTGYTATVSGARDTAGNQMTAPVSWSFTTAAAAGSCPCTIWPATATPGTPADADNSAVELGVKFRADVNGFVTGVRFYKGSSNTGTHIGNLWSSSGTLLATATFAGETASGWQQVNFGAPVAVAANTTYVVSYFAPNGHYAVDEGFFASSGVVNPPLRALANGADGPNGVYRYGSTGFPTSTFDSANYWVDVVFNQTSNDTTPPTVAGRSPSPNATGVATSTNVTAVFSEPVQSSTIGFTLTGPGGAVPAAVSYDQASQTATLDPNADLANSTSYTATVSGARDLSGNQMAAPVTWSFSTASPPPPGPDQGPGGPILVVGGGSNAFGRYTAEILRAEGLNEFATTDIGSVTATMLNGYDVVVLGQVSLTAAQVTMLTTWVNAGGNLIAYRPDAQLAGLLGLTGPSGTLSDAYLKIDTITGPGVGITDQVIQFHGTADRYTLNGATAVATLYSSATTATANPAVTLRGVGSSGGQAAAFTFDLARSIVYTRQGNPAFAGQERDGRSPIRSDDLFWPSWIDMSKLAIPQADEQQRLLANLIELMNRDRKPLPRFWYLPGTTKAVVVSSGDDHASGGTAGRFDQYKANSAAGCVVANWECLRLTSYIYTAGPLTNAQAANYTADGFEVALHVNTDCDDWTPSQLESFYASQLSGFAQKYTGIPAPLTHRIHCLVWSDWSTQPDTELRHGIRLDTSYYFWPPDWVDDQPGFFTGSGMPMRYARTDGSMIDEYQATTQMTDESEQSYPFTPNTLLDRALGPLGYYGVFTANMHTDDPTTFDDDQLIASVKAHGVPMISAKQLLTWLDGRNGSSFGSMTWSGNSLQFSVSVGSGANRLTAMVPTVSAAGTLTGLTRGGSAVSFTTQTIKGLQYATFQAAPGSYTATYASGGGAPAISQQSEQALSDGTAVVSWKTSEAADSQVFYGTQPQALTQQATDAAPASSHGVTLRGLRPRTAYYYRVRSQDSTGDVTVTPAARFTTPAADKAPPKLSAVRADPLPDTTAAISWRSSEPSDSRVEFGTSPGSLTSSRVDAEAVTAHHVVLTHLAPGGIYYYRVVSRDAAGNVTASRTRRLVGADRGVADTTVAQFRQGTRHAAAIGAAADGELRLARGQRSASFTSRVMDAMAMVTWDRASWRAQVPAGTSLRVSVRAGSISRPDGTWTRWTPLPGSGAGLAKLLGSSRYLQYRVELVSSDPASTPVLSSIGFTYTGGPVSLFPRAGGPG
jgi:methionine-rich copper-binding protein CopC